MSRLCRLFLCLAAPMLTVGSGAALAGLPAEPRMFAVIVGVDAPSAAPDAVVTPHLRRIGNTLRVDYGYDADRVIELYDAEATRERIWEAIGRLRNGMRPSDTLFLLVSLPLVDKDVGVPRSPGAERPEFLVPYDGFAGEIWTLIEPYEFEHAVESFAGSSLWIVPSCAGREGLLRRRRRSPRAAEAHEVLAFCPAPENPEVSRSAFVQALERAFANVEGGGTVTTNEIMWQLRQASVKGVVETVGSGSDRFTFTVARDALTRAVQALGSGAGKELEAIDLLVAEVRNAKGDPNRTAVAADALLSVAEDVNRAVPGRTRAIRALAEIRAVQAVDRLVALLGPSDATITAAVIDALANLGDERAAEAVQLAATHPNTTVRLAAVRGLPRLRGTLALATALDRIANDTDAGIRVAAIQVVAGLPRPGPSGIEAVTEALKDPDAAVRSEALSTLTRIGAVVRVKDVLALAQNDPDEGVKQAAVFMLGRVTDAEERLAARRAALDILRQPGASYIRAAAAWALGRLGGREAEELLTRTLDAPGDAQVRRAAAESLGHMGSTASVQSLKRYYAQSEDPADRKAAVAALGSIPSIETVDLLIRALKDEDLAVQRVAEQALKSSGSVGSAAGALSGLRDPEPGVRLEAVITLRKLRDPSTGDAVIQALVEPDPKIREALIELLAEFEDKATLKSTIDALSRHENSLVRQGAATALGLRRDSTAIQPLSERIAGRTSDLNGFVRAEAARALGRLASAELSNADASLIETSLLQATKDRDGGVRAAAAEALSALRSSSAQQALTALASDEDSRVRQAALEALRRLRASLPAFKLTFAPTVVAEAAAGGVTARRVNGTENANSVSEGTEEGKCATASTRSRAEARATSAPQPARDGAGAALLRVEAHASGGRNGLCGLCVGARCLGPAGMDTRATASSQAEAVFTLAFGDHIAPAPYLIRTEVSAPPAGSHVRFSAVLMDDKQRPLSGTGGASTIQVIALPGARYVFKALLGTAQTGSGASGRGESRQNARISIAVTPAPPQTRAGKP